MSAPRWQRPGFLPALEIVEWPRLAEHRERHEAAVAALEAAREAEAGEGEALEALCGVVEQAIADLEEHFDEGKAAYAAARAEVEPDPSPTEPPQSGLTLEEFERQSAEANAKILAEEIATAPRREATGRDFDALRTLYTRALRPGVLHEGEILSGVLVAVREAREAVAA